MILSRTVRRCLLAVLIGAFVAGATYLWRSGRVSPISVSAWLESLGPAAPLIFLGAFVGGAFVGLPGIVFVVGGRLAFGTGLGFVLGYVGGMLAITAPFVTARLLRRPAAPPWRPRGRLAGRAFALLERHPFLAVVLLRLVLWFNPPLSYALALTPIRLPVYLAACALALAPVVALAVTATSWFL